MYMFFKSNKNLKRCSMFLAGLILLQPLYLGISSPYFTIRRFNVPDTSVDLYIAKLNNTMQLGYFIGMLLVTLYLFFAPQALQRRNNWFSVATSWMTVVSSICLLLSYVVNGEQGSLTFYYYMLALSSFIFGFNQGLVMKVGVTYIPWYSASIPVAGIQIVVYQVIFLFFAEKFNFTNINFTIIVCQIAIIIVLCFTTSVLFTIGFLNHYSERLVPLSYESFDTSILRDIWMSKYPILATSVGMSWVFFSYPAIVPYKLTDMRTAYRIDLVYIFVGASIAIILCCICEFTTLGPNKNWAETRSKWVYSLFLIIPFIFLPIFFILPLHYPDSKVGSTILNNKYLMGTLGLIYIMIHITLVTVGYSAAAMQTEQQFKGELSAFNTLYTYFLTVIIILVSQGYLSFYGEVHSDKVQIPEGLNTVKTFFYWVKMSFEYGWRCFKETFTSDMKADILNVK